MATALSLNKDTLAATFSGNLLAASNNTLNIGSSTNKFANIYATNFNGNLSGNASTATKATQDSDGNQINSTYLKLSGGTLTGNLIFMASNQHNIDQFIYFKYSTTDLDNYSWRLGYLGTGSGDTNYFTIQSNGSGAWASILNLGLTSKTATFAGNVTASSFTGSGASLTSLNASNISSGTLSSSRLPTVPITKGGTGATTAAAALTNLGITATAAELNKMDGVTATTTELNYVDGVTSNIQTQLNAKMKRGSYERIEGTSSAKKDLNNYTTAGFYNVKTANVNNCPSGIGIDAVLLVYAWDSTGYECQEITETAASTYARRWIRHKTGSSWTAWKALINEENIGSYAPPLYTVTQTDPGAGSQLANNKLCIVYS